jgi:tetratricopeptide (TPR) repeat protein
MAMNVPSVEEFLKQYKAGNYYAAIGLPKSAGKKETAEAIDAFEREHVGKSPLVPIALARIRIALLDNRDDMDSSKPAKPLADTDIITMSIVRTLLGKAQKYIQEGRLDDAVSACSMAVSAAPGTPMPYRMRGYVNLLRPDYEPYLQSVVEDCSRAIELGDGDGLAYNDRGRAYYRMGDLKRASEDYYRAMELCPSLTITALNVMSTDILRGEYGEAVGIYGLYSGDLLGHELLIGASLVCIALALQGKDYREYVTPLLDRGLTYAPMIDWCTSGIDQYLDRIGSGRSSSIEVAKARDIQRMFKEHAI